MRKEKNNIWLRGRTTFFAAVFFTILLWKLKILPGQLPYFLMFFVGIIVAVVLIVVLTSSGIFKVWLNAVGMNAFYFGLAALLIIGFSIFLSSYLMPLIVLLVLVNFLIIVLHVKKRTAKKEFLLHFTLALLLFAVLVNFFMPVLYTSNTVAKEVPNTGRFFPWDTPTMTVYETVPPTGEHIDFNAGHNSVVAPFTTFFWILAALVLADAFFDVLLYYTPFKVMTYIRYPPSKQELAERQGEESPPSYGAEYTAEDGHIVRSKGELIIDNWLSSHGISHYYEPAITGTKCYADFFLPKTECYIEYLGLKGNPEYDAKTQLKEKLYQERNLKCVFIDNADLSRLSTKFAELAG